MQIGAVKLESPVLLAPMAGIADLPFRLLCRELGGVGLAGSELLNSRAIVRGIPAVREKARLHPDDAPLSVQVYGNIDDPLPQAAAWAVKQGATIIDINMGCPIDKVCKKNGGSLLLKTPRQTANLAKQIVEACDGVPVTAKVRLGWSEGELSAPEISKRLGHLPLRSSRWRGSLIHGKRLAGVTAQGPRTVFSSAVGTKVFRTNYKRGNEFLHRLIKFTMCTGRKNKLRHYNLCTGQ